VIHIIVATYSEARPVILFYKLKRVITINEFHIFENQKLNISLTISGIGNIMSGAATSFTYCEYQKVKNHIWINFGLAGTKKEKIGEIFLVNKVSDFDKKKKVYFPMFAQDFQLKKKECISYHKKNDIYNFSLSDMESYGFFSVADKFASREFIFLVKIISDNEIESIDFFSKKDVFELINQNMLKLAKLIIDIQQTFLSINNHQLKVLTFLVDLKKKFRLSFNQELKIKKLLYICFSKNKLSSHYETILHCNDINDVIYEIERRIKN